VKSLIIGDCHGEAPDIPEEGFDLILCAGDICGGTDEMRNTMFEAMDTEKEWYELFGEEEAKEAVKSSIQEGKEIFDELDSLGVPVFIVPGNWDWTGENSDWEFLEGRGYPEILEEFDNLHDLNFDCREEKGWNFIGYGPCSGPEIPQYEDDKPESEEEMDDIQRDYEDKKQRLQKLFTCEKTVFLSHNVPHDTSLDKIDNEDSPVHGRHYGSVIVRELIEEFSPEYSVAGHMHEGKVRETLGDTECLNTGLNTVWILDTDDGISKYS
jgi:Icc-related predicted phosphoesterase